MRPDGATENTEITEAREQASVPSVISVARASILERLLRKGDLAAGEASASMDAIMDGAWTHAQIAGFLIALRAKGETAEEIAGFASAMRARAVAVALDGLDAIDTCGTGGDGACTFNVSTAAALVAAGAGARVAKHGNRAVSSRCGSADVLEALGVRIEVAPALAARCIREAGFGFLFAPAHHAALKHAAPVRRELGVRTVLNVLGPLANPAGVKRQVVGVFEPRLTGMLAAALARLGSTAALVVHGSDGLDEVTTTGPTRVTHLSGATDEWHPREHLGLEPARAEDLAGGDAAANARTILEVLGGARGPRRDIVLANAGAALLVAGIAATIREGVERAAASIDSRRALGVLERVRRMTNEVTA